MQQSAERRTVLYHHLHLLLFVSQKCGTSVSSEISVLSVQNQQQTAGGTVTVISRPQESQSCQHSWPEEKVKSLVTLGFFCFSAIPCAATGAPLLMCAIWDYSRIAWWKHPRCRYKSPWKGLGFNRFSEGSVSQQENMEREEGREGEGEEATSFCSMRKIALGRSGKHL